MRGRRRSALVVGAVLFSMWLAVAAFTVVRAVEAAKAGRADLAVAKSAAGRGRRGLAEAAPALGRAAKSFGRARARLDSAVLFPLDVLPVVGRQLASARALSSAGVTLSSAGAEAVGGIARVSAMPKSTPTERLAAVRALAAVSEGLATKVEHVPLGPDSALVAPLARARATAGTDLARLRLFAIPAASALRGVSMLLAGHHTVFVIGANNAEMRNGVASYLSAGQVSVDNGVITTGHFLPTSGLRPARGVVLPSFMAARWGWLQPGAYMDALGMSPNFPANAPLAAEQWRASGGDAADTVIEIDVVGLADLLSATGPVTMAGRVLTAHNAVPYLTAGQYAGARFTNPEDHLGALVDAVVHRLEEPHIDTLQLAKALGEAAAGRHLMIWSADAQMEQAWVRAGVSGQASGSALMVSLVNLGANKLDPFVTAHVSLIPLPGGARAKSTTFRLSVALHNNAAPVPSLINGPYPGLGLTAGEYSGLLAINLPGRLGGAALTSGQGVAVSGWDGGTNVLAPVIRLGPGASETFTTVFSLRARHGALSVLSSGRVPPEHWTYRGASFNDTKPHVLRW